jgi:parallel beta-helix repeat protein
MQKKSFILVILAVLLCQPIVAGINMPSRMAPVQTPRSVAQGFRVDPSALIDHVPILINGTGDFVAQGWPGAGTQASPYRISSLNITRDVGLRCIDIMNTQTYFKIEDCFVNQGSQLEAIRFTNTSHGAIDYSTIYGQDVVSATGAAITLNDANNTVVDHIESYGRGALGIQASNSYHLTCSRSVFDSADYRALLVQYSDYLTVLGCEFYNYNPSWYCTYVNQVNHTSVSNSRFYADGTVAGIAMQSSYYSSISDSYISAPSAGDGLYLTTCPGIVLSNITAESADFGIFISNSPGLSLADAHVSGSSNYGIEIQNSPNSTLADSDIYDSGTYGLYLLGCQNTSINTVSVDTANEGILCEGSDFLVAENVEIRNIDVAFEATQCDNGSITDSTIQHATSDGIYIEIGYNWTITNNLVEYTDGYAIAVYTGDNPVITANTINVCQDGIYLDTAADAVVTSNQVSKSTSMSIGASTCDRAIISDNTVVKGYDGISCDSSENLTITGNTLDLDGWNGISFYGCDNAVVEGNTIGNSLYRGISVYVSQGIQFLDNTMTDCGFFFEPTSGGYPPGTILPYQYFNHTFSGNTINSKSLYYARNLEHLVLDADNYAQFILLNVSDVVIHDGTFGRVTLPIEVLRSDHIAVDGITAQGNIAGLYFAACDNVTIDNSLISGAAGYGGIYANYLDNITLSGSTLTRCDGLSVYNSQVVDVTSTGFSYSSQGVFGYNSDNFTVEGCSFEHLVSEAVDLQSGGQYSTIKSNFIWNVSYGVALEGSDSVVSGNVIYHAQNYGIALWSSSNNDNVTENYIESCNVGIYVSISDNQRILNNTILYCNTFAIDVAYSTGDSIYYNLFALSGTANARDRPSGYTKNWDDGVSTGNSWDDYTPPGVYNIPGGSNSVDNYPMTYLPDKPIVDHPLDLYYAEGSHGNTLVWHPYDNELRNWVLYIDGNNWATGAWNLVDITVNVDGLSYGMHQVKIIIYDVDQNNVTDTLTIHVYDGTPPVISNVANTVAFVDGTGQVLTWKVSDLHPGDYVVYMDDDVWTSGAWTSGTLDVSIDGLSEGEHSLLTVISDLDGNTASDSVLIKVVKDATAPTIDSPPDMTYTFGETGNSIVWTPTDAYPSSFLVTLNGSVYTEGSWGGSRVVVNVDGLSVGPHVFSITVRDGSGNTATDSVTVTVLATTGAVTPPPPLDMGLVLLVVGAAAAAVVVVVVIILLRRRGTI